MCVCVGVGGGGGEVGGEGGGGCLCNALIFLMSVLHKLCQVNNDYGAVDYRNLFARSVALI